jgi:hypothetical protein
MKNKLKYIKQLTLFDKLAIIASPKDFVILRKQSINGRDYIKTTFTSDPDSYKYDKDLSKVYETGYLKGLINSNKI